MGVLGVAFITLHTSLFISCSDDDATYTPVPTLGITASDVLFEPMGGTGSITTNSTGTLEATTQGTWLSLLVQGNRVAVSVQPNATLNGRSAKVQLKADGKETSIVVTQKGMVFEVAQKAFVVEQNAQATVQSAVTHMMEVSTASEADWLTPTFDEQQGLLSIALDTNTTGTVRTGLVTVTSGEVTERVSVTQYDLTEDIYGYYSFDYRTKEGEAQHLLAILEGGEMEVIVSEDFSLFIPVDVDADAHTLTVQAPANVGRYAGSYYTYLLAGHERAGSTTDQSTFANVASSTTLQAVQTNGLWSLETPVFGGSWDRYNSSGEYMDSPTVNMWIFDLYTGRVATDADWNDKWAGFTLMKCCQPRLTKLSNAEGEAWLSQY